MLLVLASRPGGAQRGGIAGVVRDPQMAVVSAAEVSATAARTAVVTTALTDAQGRYTFAALPPGSYLVDVHARGFDVATSEAIAVTAGGTATRDFVLTVEGRTESVTVTGGVNQGYRVAAVTSPGP